MLERRVDKGYRVFIKMALLGDGGFQMKKAIASLLAGFLIFCVAPGAESAKKKLSSPSKPSKTDRQKAWELCRAKYGARLHHVEVLKDGRPICYINY
jgi:hypothetical protein